MLLRAGFNIDSARTPREAFYGQLPADEALLAKQTETGPWVFSSQHITIEKNIDSSNPAMGPHWTLIYRHKQDASQTCIVHAYFNKKILLNGCYQQRVIKTHPDGRETTLFSDNYDEKTTRMDVPYPGVQLTVEQIKNLASIGSRLFSALNAEKAKTYLDLHKAIEQIDLEITQLLHDKSEGYLSNALTLLEHLTLIVKELNDYSDGKKNITDVLILEQVLQLKSQQEKYDTQSRQDDPRVDVEEETAGGIEAINAPSRVNSLHDTERDIMQSQILDLLGQVTSMQAGSDPAPEQFYPLLQQLNTMLTLYELIYESTSDKEFYRIQQTRLPAAYFNLPVLFKNAVLTGNLPVVKGLFETVELHMDLTVLFSELLLIIDTGRDQDLCDRLIPVVHYLHEHSDLFQAFVLFKMTRLEYTGLTGPELFDGQLQVNILSSLYIHDNLKAYRLYLSLGCSPEGRHSRYSNVAFNALQTVLFTNNRSFNKTPYIDTLFEHDAVTSITLNKLPEECSITEALGESAINPAMVQATLFNYDKLSLTKQKGSKLVKQTHPKSIRLAQEVPELEVIVQNTNILSLAWSIYQLRDPEILASIAGHCDMKMCLLEFSHIIAQDNFSVSFIPCTRGGVAFHSNQDKLEKNAKETMNFLDRDNLTVFVFDNANPSQRTPCTKMLLAEHKTMRTYVTFNPTHVTHGAGDVAERKKLLASAEVVYKQFDLLFDTLSSEEKRAFVKSILKIAIQNKLAGGSQLETLNLYTAAIIANSLIHQMMTDDYRCMIKLFIAYGKMFDEMKGHKTIVPRSICTNLKLLLTESKLNKEILSALNSDMQGLYEVIHSEETKLTSSLP